MVQFLSTIFFSWISSIFVGFFKSSCFFCVILYIEGHCDIPPYSWNNVYNGREANDRTTAPYLGECSWPEESRTKMTVVPKPTDSLKTWAMSLHDLLSTGLSLLQVSFIKKPRDNFTYRCTHTVSLCGLNTLRTGDADFRFYITTVQDGWRKSAFLTRACFPCTVQLIMQYIESVSEWFCWRMFIETWPHSELTFRHRSSSI